LITASVDVLFNKKIILFRYGKKIKRVAKFTSMNRRRKRPIYGCGNAKGKLGIVLTFSCVRERIEKKVLCPFACLVL